MSLERVISTDVGRPVLNVQLKAAVQPRAFVPIDLTLGVEGAGPGGVRLPLEVIISGPTKTRTRTLNRYVPECLTVTPSETGAHIVVVRETAHNYAYGLLKLDVANT